MASSLGELLALSSTNNGVGVAEVLTEATSKSKSLLVSAVLARDALDEARVSTAKGMSEALIWPSGRASLHAGLASPTAECKDGKACEFGITCSEVSASPNKPVLLLTGLPKFVTTSKDSETPSPSLCMHWQDHKLLVIPII
jgi:hypothetical protein